MNTKNLEYLKEGLKYLGFGDKLNTELENRIKEQKPNFQLSVEGEFAKGGTKEKVGFVLDFKKSDQSDMYFFNRYQATLKKDDPAQEKTQTFYITKNAGITAKEAYNLLDGRAVNKNLLTADEKPYNAWLQLEFAEKDKHDNFKVKQYHQGYGYDLESTLKRYPIKELGTDDDKGKLMKSLEKGNIQQVTFTKEGNDERMFIAANPQYKSIDLYNSKMEKQFQGIERREKKDLDRSPEKKETAKQDIDDDGPAGQERKRSRKKGIAT